MEIPPSGQCSHLLLRSVVESQNDQRVTVNPLVNVLLCASGLVTFTLRAPVAALDLILILAVSCVVLLNAHDVTVIPVPKLHVPPLWKLLPPNTTLSACPRAPLFGVTLVKLGAGRVVCVTVKPLVKVLLCASGLVTVTFRAPVVAVPEMVTLAVN
jgi:hypothetical protein